MKFSKFFSSFLLRERTQTQGMCSHACSVCCPAHSCSHGPAQPGTFSHSPQCLCWVAVRSCCTHTPVHVCRMSRATHPEKSWKGFNKYTGQTKLIRAVHNQAVEPTTRMFACNGPFLSTYSSITSCLLFPKSFKSIPAFGFPYKHLIASSVQSPNVPPLTSHSMSYICEHS